MARDATRTPNRIMTRRHRKKRSAKSGLPPGTLVHIGEESTSSVKINIIDYDPTHFEEKIAVDAKECCHFKDKPTVTWIDIEGIHDAKLIEQLGRDYGLHPLLLEDIMNSEQRPKMEDYGSYIFIVLKMLSYDKENDSVKAEQVSLILGNNFVISLQEGHEGDVFDGIRARIRNDKGRHRKMGTDYLCYSLIDAVVDNYFIILEQLGERIEDIEDELVANPTRETIHAIHALKREMIFLRKSVWPLREVISALERGESALIQQSTAVYLRDVYDHTIQVIDNIETYRDMLAGMLDIYLSSLSNKMNEIMKVLTIIATLFIPLTFLAGVYGMNFRHFPEIEWRWGYAGFWAVTIIVAVGMIIYFKRKKWL